MFPLILHNVSLRIPNSKKFHDKHINDPFCINYNQYTFPKVFITHLGQLNVTSEFPIRPNDDQLAKYGRKLGPAQGKMDGDITQSKTQHS